MMRNGFVTLPALIYARSMDVSITTRVARKIHTRGDLPVDWAIE
jgi:hypothetical protein